MIKFGYADIKTEDIRRLTSVLKSGWLVNGPIVEEIEKIFCRFTGARYAVAMNSCTAALHAACAYLRRREKIKRIRIPEITHVATAHAAMLAGMSVDFVDVDPVDGIMLLKEILGREIVVHLAGQPCEEVKKTTIEDCAHALGTRFADNTHVGTRGLCGCFSFYPTKHITCAEGGMLITNNDDLFHFARQFRAFGITTPPEKRNMPAEYDSLFVAPNYRMPDILAALLIGQMERFEANQKHREYIARLYHNSLDGCVRKPSWRKGTSWFIYQVLYDRRDALIEHLKKHGIQTSIHYRRPLSSMSAYKNNALKKINRNAYRFADTVLSLPVHLGIGESEAQTIIAHIKSFTS